MQICSLNKYWAVFFAGINTDVVEPSAGIQQSLIGLFRCEVSCSPLLCAVVDIKWMIGGYKHVHFHMPQQILHSYSLCSIHHIISPNFLLSFNGFSYSFLTSSMQMLEIVLIKHVAAVLGEIHCMSLSINGLYSTDSMLCFGPFWQ